MNARFTIAILVVVAALLVLVSSAVKESSKPVVTVDELVQSRTPRSHLRLGARVADSEIRYETQPAFKLFFTVADIAKIGETLPVVYAGIRPDTFQPGRDVILEGDFDGSSFQAKVLLTQCPSKYKPPVPTSGSPERRSTPDENAHRQHDGAVPYGDAG